MKIFSKSLLGNEQFPALTGIRGLAMFMVFFHHLPLHVKPDFLIGLQLSFYWSITLFFTLSSFLITYHYYNQMEVKGPWLLQYFGNRFARICPLYFLVLTIVVLLFKYTDPIFLLQNYTLTHNLFFIFKSHGMAIAPSWSLTVEECFYISTPVIFILCKKYNVLVPFFISVLILVLLFFTYGSGSFLEHTLFPLFSGTFFGYSLAFYSGVYLALLVMKKNRTIADSRLTIHDCRFTITGVAAIAVITLFLIYATNKANPVKYIVMIVGNNLLLPIPVVILYYGFIYENSLLKRILAHRVMKLFGRSSYAFYLIHMPLIHYTKKVFKCPGFNDAWYNMYVAIIFTTSLTLAILLFIFYEHPMNLFIRRRIKALANK